MSVFPDQPMFRGAHRPQRLEGEIFDLEYEGELPAALDGTFYRCGPDPCFPPRAGTDIGINGDGFVSAFRFEGGHVDFRHRYVRTDKFLAEREARRALFGSYRNPFTDDPSVAGVDRTTANTSIIWYDGRLMAAKEDGLPHEIDPLTLETLGKFNFDGKLRSPSMTAHPKVDPVTGELIFYAFECAGLATPDIALCIADRDGALVSEEWFHPPYAGMIHDFAITENYVVFPLMPTTSDLERMRAGGSHFGWDPSLPTWIGVVPKAGGVAAIRYFKGPARWSFHTMNAFEDGSLLHLDTTAAPTNGFFPHVDGSPPNPASGNFLLTRWTCDLSLNDLEPRFAEQTLYDKPSDFYDVDPRFVGRPYRYGLMAVKDYPAGTVPGSFNALGRFDHDDGSATLWNAGPGSAVQEPVFVPRGADAGEGDGYLLSIVNRHAENRAELVVLDATRLAAGPVATIFIPINLRMAFHGLFVPRAELARARSGAA